MPLSLATWSRTMLRLTIGLAVREAFLSQRFSCGEDSNTGSTSPADLRMWHAEELAATSTTTLHFRKHF